MITIREYGLLLESDELQKEFEAAQTPQEQNQVFVKWNQFVSFDERRKKFIPHAVTPIARN